MSQVAESSSMNSGTKRMQDAFDVERSESRSNHEKELRQIKEESEETLLAAKKEYNERLQAERAGARDDVRRLKEDLYNQYGKNSTQDLREQQVEKDRLNVFRKDLSKQTHQKIEELEDNHSNQLNEERERADTRLSQELDIQKKSNVEEQKKLQREHENYLRANELDTVSVKNHANEISENYSKKLIESTLNVNRNAQRQLEQQESAFGKAERESHQEQARLEQNYNSEIRNIKNHHEQATTKIIDQSNVNQDKSMAVKDHTLRDYLAAKSKENELEIEKRDAKIHDLESTGDPLKVSPYVVKKINDASEHRGMIALDEVQKINSKNLTAIRERDQEDRDAIAQNFRTEVNGVQKDVRHSLDLQSKQFRDAYSDLENTHESEVATLKAQKKMNSERMYKQHSVELTGAQISKQDALNEQREALVSQRVAVLDEADTSRRNQDREWFMRVNDLRRGFEQKIAEERDQHEKENAELHLEYDKKLRDQSRLSKRALEDRIRAYEHQISQQGLAFKEKERFLTEHYEEELATMKRTNAHLIQKKS